MLWHHATDEELPELLRALPEGLNDKGYPMKSFFDYGVNVSSHSDYPALANSPDDSFGIMEIAVTGVMAGENGTRWWPEELITREQAIGKYADFLLVDKDVLSCPVTEIHEAKPAATYFEGKKVFSM